MKHLTTLLILLATLTTHADTGNTMTGIFDPDFRTLTIKLDGNRLAPPVITLNSTDQLTIGFDALHEDRDYLRYSIYHCNADWQISDLIDNEVFDNFNYADITDYAFSRATSTHYVHYTITLPNPDFQFRLSGNYLLQVYYEDNPDNILLQARFMVTENTVAINGTATSRTDIGYNSTHQQLQLNVDLNRIPIRNPYTDLRLTITQNNRPDNAVIITHPSRVSANTAIYEHLPQLIFPAGNEYRRIETTQLTYPGMGVDHIQFHAPYYHHILNLDTPRATRPYTYDSTQHGRYFIREYNSTNSDIEADYTVVHFTLDKLPEPDTEIYLDGDFTYRHLDPTSRLTYDPATGLYHKELLLKQGAYNYQYLTLPANTTTATTAPVEGNFYQTVNEYLVALYYRAPGDRYDRLLGLTLIHSGQ